MTITGIADSMYLDPADVRVVVGWLGEDIPEDDVPTDVADFLYLYLDGRGCERSVPERYWVGLSPDWREEV